MEIAQLLLSLLHSWGLDDDLDRVCQVKLGLLRPMVSVLITLEKKICRTDKLIGAFVVWRLIQSQSHVVVFTHLAQHNSIGGL